MAQKPLFFMRRGKVKRKSLSYHLKESSSCSRNRIQDNLTLSLWKALLALPYSPLYSALPAPGQRQTVSHTGQASPVLCCQATYASWPCQSADNQLPAAFSSFKIQLNVSSHSVTIVWTPHSGTSPEVALGSQKRKALLSWKDHVHGS